MSFLTFDQSKIHSETEEVSRRLSEVVKVRVKKDEHSDHQTYKVEVELSGEQRKELLGYQKDEVHQVSHAIRSAVSDNRAIVIDSSGNVLSDEFDAELLAPRDKELDKVAWRGK